jgi:hypothetical protein
VRQTEKRGNSGQRCQRNRQRFPPRLDLQAAFQARARSAAAPPDPSKSGARRPGNPPKNRQRSTRIPVCSGLFRPSTGSGIQGQFNLFRPCSTFFNLLRDHGRGRDSASAQRRARRSRCGVRPPGDRTARTADRFRRKSVAPPALSERAGPGGGPPRPRASLSVWRRRVPSAVRCSEAPFPPLARAPLPPRAGVAWARGRDSASAPTAHGVAVAPLVAVGIALQGPATGPAEESPSRGRYGGPRRSTAPALSDEAGPVPGLRAAVPGRRRRIGLRPDRRRGRPGGKAKGSACGKWKTVGCPFWQGVRGIPLPPSPADRTAAAVPTVARIVAAFAWARRRASASARPRTA